MCLENTFETVECAPHGISAKNCLLRSLEILDEGEVRALWDRRIFLAASFILFALIIATLGIEAYFPYFRWLVSFYTWFLEYFSRELYCALDLHWLLHFVFGMDSLVLPSRWKRWRKLSRLYLFTLKWKHFIGALCVNYWRHFDSN